MKILFQICFLMIATSILLSCQKQEKAGFGGNTNLVIRCQHHGVTLDSMTVFIKFNTQEAPLDGIFDVDQKVVKQTLNDSYASISGLKKGKYYLYADGYDPSISEEVKGGIPYIIDEEGTQEIVIPVTEKH